MHPSQAISKYKDGAEASSSYGVLASTERAKSHFLHKA